MTPWGLKTLSRLLPALAGWILLALFAGSATAATAVVTTPALNLRAVPGTSARVLATLKRGSRVEVIADQGQWLKVRWRKMTGYLYNHPGYVRLETAAANRTEPADSLRRQSRSIDRKIREKQQTVSKIKARENTVLSDLDRMDRKINRLRKQSRSVHTQLRELGRTIARENTRLKKLTRRIAAEESYAASRLTALYKLERLGKIELLASASSFYAFQLRRRALRQILRRDREIIARLAADKARQQELITARRNRLAEKKKLEKTYRQQLAELSRQQGLRRQRLAEIRSRKSLELAALKELRQSAAQLDRKLRELQRRPPPAAAAYQPPRAPSPTPKNRPHKGLPNIPVKGKIINRFGPYRDPQLHFESHRNGIDIRAERGAPIRSVDAGVVLFSQWFKGYGNVIIIDHGNHFYSVYAHIDTFFKQAGDRVERGEVIATVGDTGSLQGPILYFEIRRKGKPVNPRKWVRVTE
jgi:septal ring factor EnvC (AmiA/AmiB activator)